MSASSPLSHNDRHVELVIEGSRVPPGAVDLDTLASLTNGLLRAFRAVARERRGLPASKSGQPGKDIREATGLRLVGLRPGSTVLVLESAESDLFGGRADETIDEFMRQIGGDGGVDEAVIDPLDEALRSLGDNARMRFSFAGREVSVDGERIERLRRPSAPVDDQVSRTVSGWFHAADLDPDEVRVRDAQNVEWICRYPPELEPTIRSLLGRVVRVSGVGRRRGRRGDLDVRTIEAVALPADVPLSGITLSPEELVRSAMGVQEISGPQALEALKAAVDPDDPEEVAFADALREFG